MYFWAYLLDATDCQSDWNQQTAFNFRCCFVSIRSFFFMPLAPLSGVLLSIEIIILFFSSSVCENRLFDFVVAAQAHEAQYTHKHVE